MTINEEEHQKALVNQWFLAQYLRFCWQRNALNDYRSKKRKSILLKKRLKRLRKQRRRHALWAESLPSSQPETQLPKVPEKEINQYHFHLHYTR